MKYMKALLMVSVLCGIFCAVGNDALAQKKKKEKPRKPPTLENTYWSLYEMDGKMVETPATEREVYIKLLDKKSQLEGYAGVSTILPSISYTDQ